jgi:hypothetical protein
MIPMWSQISQFAAMRRDDICIYVSPANRARLETIIADRNSKATVLATAEGRSTNAMMRLTGRSKPCVWRWQERYIAEGVDGLMRDKARSPGGNLLSRKVRLKVLAKTANTTPASATHWSRASMAAETGIIPSSIGRIWAEASLKPHALHVGFLNDGGQHLLARTTRLQERRKAPALPELGDLQRHGAARVPQARSR